MKKPNIEKRIEKLERRVRELENAPREQHFHFHYYHPIPYYQHYPTIWVQPLVQPYLHPPTWTICGSADSASSSGTTSTITFTS